MRPPPCPPLLCLAGNLTSSKDLAKKLERVKPYLTGHGTTGGITISGGEPLLQVRCCRGRGRLGQVLSLLLPRALAL